MPDDELTWTEELVLIGLTFLFMLTGGVALAIVLFAPSWWAALFGAVAWFILYVILWVLRRSDA
jgi:type IV secretory pathway TrbD component